MNILLSFLVINLCSKVYTQFINNLNTNEVENQKNYEFLTSDNFNLYNTADEPDVPNLDTLNLGSTDSKDSTVDGEIKTFASTHYSTNDIRNLNVLNQDRINNNSQKNSELSQNSSNYTTKPNPFLHRASANSTKFQLENFESNSDIQKPNPFLPKVSANSTKILLENSESNSNIQKPNPFLNKQSENYKQIPQINLTNTQSTAQSSVNSSSNSYAFNHYQYYKEWSSVETSYEHIENFIKPQLEYGKSLQYAIPYIPEPLFYQNFFNIYNFVENQQTEDLSQYEMESINDDFNGRSIVAPGQYPHMAAVGFLSNEDQIEFKCGGSLISDSFIITAAHCCYLNGDTPVLVKLGIINLKNHTEDYTPQNRQISEIFMHPYYNLSMHYHDIALLKLKTPVKFTQFVRPILLWASNDIPYERAFTMGYGSTSFAKAPTNILTELDLSLIPLQKCKKSFPSDEKAPQGIVESQICAKDFEKNRDTCQGDSGGPLQLNLEHSIHYNIRYYLVGIISYGEFCRGKHPGVYTRISSYSRWIASIVWPDYFEDFE